MFYPDSERRIEEINKIVELFKSKGYPKTAKEAARFADLLCESSFPSNLPSKFNGILAIFEEEFKNSLIEGKTYRARVFAEVEEIVVGAVNRTYPEFFNKTSEILPILDTIRNGRNVIGDIADEIVTIAKSNRKLMFLLCCYGYLIMVEGIFDEISRALYFFSKLTKSHVPRVTRLLNKQVSDIMKDFGTVPVFLENWEEKKHIRNAIAHATTYYDPAKDEVRFVDTLSHYDETKRLHDFMLIVLEFDDLADSFSYILCLLGLLELFTIKNLKFT